jgi:hypothetical protein
MRLGLFIGAVVALSCMAVGTASAEVEFGAPDYSNYLSRPGWVTCDWIWDNYFTACPTPQEVSVPTTNAKGPAKGEKP